MSKPRSTSTRDVVTEELLRIAVPVSFFDTPLLQGILLRRYKRFLADVRFADGHEETVHCANPGAMRACGEPGRPVLVSDSRNPKRKLRLTLEMIRMGRTWVGVNTNRPNQVIGALLDAHRLLELDGYKEVQREVSCGESRLDFRLRASSAPREEAPPDCWVEVKNATWRVPGPARHVAFPDAVTTRGRRHLEALAARAAMGERAVILFHVGRNDVRRFRPADEVDPTYGQTLRQVAAAGVEILAYRFRYGPDGIQLTGRLPVDLSPFLATLP